MTSNLVANQKKTPKGRHPEKDGCLGNKVGKNSWHLRSPPARKMTQLLLNTVACPKRQMSVLNGKSTFLGCFPPKIDKIWCVLRFSQGPSSHRTSSTLVGKQQRKVDLPFRTDICHLGQATVGLFTVHAFENSPHWYMRTVWTALEQMYFLQCGFTLLRNKPRLS